MSLPSRKPVNYLNNKDILKEIHESKTAYCYFTKPEYHRYDFIVDMPQSSIEESLEYAYKPESIQQARETQALRMDLEQGLTKGTTDPLSIPLTDLVFRVMTWDHVPVAPKQPRKTVKKKTAKDIFEFEEEDPDSIFADLEDNTTKAEVDDILQEQGKVEVACEFCGLPYVFDALYTEALFQTTTILGSKSVH